MTIKPLKDWTLSEWSVIGGGLTAIIGAVLWASALYWKVDSINESIKTLAVDQKSTNSLLLDHEKRLTTLEALRDRN